jgi:3-deoxy-7-phosphoheptulonate synthase
MDIPLKQPNELIIELPLSIHSQLFKNQLNREIQAIFNGMSSKKLLIVGPCSIHSEKGALEYAEKLSKLQNLYHKELLILMRVHVEKPRTADNWRGFVYDPFLNGSYDIQVGITKTRQLMLSLLEMEVGISSEVLDPYLIPYFQDCLSFGIIGARTITSPIHRLVCSDLPYAVGFKNRLDGDIDSAIEAMKIAGNPQTFIHTDLKGASTIKKSLGNPFKSLILRGSYQQPNYFKENLFQAQKKLVDANLSPVILVDCSHGNQLFDPQEEVVKKVIQEHFDYSTPIAGMLIESYLKAGRFSGNNGQSAPYDLSITDSCLSFETTKKLIETFHSKLISSNHNLCLKSAN